MNRLLFILIFSSQTGFIVGQQHSSAQQSQFLILEGNLGLTTSDQFDSRLIGGFGLWNYISIDEIQGSRRKSSLGLSVPMRLTITTVNQEEKIYENSLSLASMFRLSIQQHPDKDKLWFFMAVGPELRIDYQIESTSQQWMIQQEFGIKLFNRSSILPNNELGFSVSWPVQKKNWEENQSVLFFIRMSVF